MEKLLIVVRARSRWTRTVLNLGAAFGLAGALWFMTAPIVSARLMSPTEMIEAGLPPGVMVKTAGKPQFLTAVCAAVKNNRKAAPSIARAAVSAHREYSGDIVATVVRCARGEGKDDCELNGSIAASAISASPDSAAVIDDAILSIAPGCADAIQRATTGDDVGATEDIPAEGPGGTGAPSNVQPPPFGGGGGGGVFFPPQAQVQICDNGRQRAIRFSRVDRFLGNHPGSFIGSCQITPVTSR